MGNCGECCNQNATHVDKYGIRCDDLKNEYNSHRRGKSKNLITITEVSEMTKYAETELEELNIQDFEHRVKMFAFEQNKGFMNLS